MSTAIALGPVSGPLLAGVGFVVGAAAGAVVMGRRIAARKARDDGAAQSGGTGRPLGDRDQRIERALNTLPVGVVITDTEGEPVYRNRIAERYDRARHADALVEAALADVIRGATAGVTMEHPIDLYGPPPRNLHLRGTPTYTDLGGELTGSVVIIEDVTLTQEVDRVRKDFVANVSHELRTPIGAIGLLAETLRGSDDPEVVDRLAGRLQSEALRLGDMIDDLLALSKLESGQIEEPERMDLVQVVRLATDRAASAAEQRQIRITTVAPPNGPVQIDGDQGQMVSAVANLLDNAVKYSDAGAEVTVTVATAGRNASEATVTVTDTGVGIPEAALKRIFERFYRVDDARSRATGGTGLGLSIVRHVALNHRGTISVTSTEGQGSSFTMRLPRTLEPGP